MSVLSRGSLRMIGANLVRSIFLRKMLTVHIVRGDKSEFERLCDSASVGISKPTAAVDSHIVGRVDAGELALGRG
jgi:hypothetical protein